MVAPTTSAERLADSGFGVVIYALIQQLLSLKQRPLHPVEWILRRLKDGAYFIREADLEAFLSNAICTAAHRSQKPLPGGGELDGAASNVSPRPPTIASQMLVALTCDLSQHHELLHGGRLMDDVMLMRFARLVADFAMWETSSIRSSKDVSPVMVKQHMTLAQYVTLSGSALRLLTELRPLAQDRRRQGSNLTLFDAIFDLAEVLLKLRCFAAQAEVDAFGDCRVPFPSMSPSAALELSISCKRSLRLVFVQPFPQSCDGLTTSAQQTSVHIVANLFSLVHELLASAGFPEASVHCIATDLPHVATEQRLFDALQVRAEAPIDEAGLHATLQPLRFLDAEVRSQRHASLTCESVSVVPFAFATHLDSAIAEESGCECPSRLCRTIRRVCGPSPQALSEGATLEEDVAPPCVVVLPVAGNCALVSAPIPVLVGMCVAEHIAKSMQRPRHVAEAASVAPVAAATDDKKGQRKALAAGQKKDGEPVAPPAPSAVAGSDGDASGTVEPQKTRRAVFGEAFDFLFRGVDGAASGEGTATEGGVDTSFLVLLLRPLQTVTRTPSQILGVSTLLLALSKTLGLPATTKPNAVYTLPMFGAVAFAWSATSSRHSIEDCWWHHAAAGSAEPSLGTISGGPSRTHLSNLDVPLARCITALQRALLRSPVVRHATALSDSFIKAAPIVRPDTLDAADASRASEVSAEEVAPLFMQSLLSAFQSLPSANDSSLSPPQTTNDGKSPSASPKSSTLAREAVFAQATKKILDRTANNNVEGCDKFCATILRQKVDATLQELAQVIVRQL